MRRPTDYSLLLANSVLNLIRETKKDKGVMLTEVQIPVIAYYLRIWLKCTATKSTHNSQALLEKQRTCQNERVFTTKLPPDPEQNTGSL